MSFGFVAVDDGKVSVWDNGVSDRPAIFLFHSLGTSAELWTPQFETLGDSYRLIAMDCRGHGGTLCARKFSIKACVQDAIRVLQSSGAEKVHVVGLSMGGLMAAELAAHQSTVGLVQSVTLACSYATLTGGGSLQRFDQTRDLLSKVSMREFAQQYLSDTATSSIGGRWHELLCDVIGAVEADDYLATLQEILFFDCSAALSRLTVPALVISGEVDRRISQAVTDQLVGSIANVVTARLPEAGHLANMEAPGAFNAALEDFWKNVDQMSG